MHTSPTCKSPVAADRLGIAYYVLIGLIRGKRIPAPPKDSSGDYCWSADDLDRARAALAARRRPPVARTEGAISA